MLKLSVVLTEFCCRRCSLLDFKCIFVCLCLRNDAKTVNVITTACFSKVTKVRVFLLLFLFSFYIPWHLYPSSPASLPAQDPSCWSKIFPG